jgi:hypothetical protein
MIIFSGSANILLATSIGIQVCTACFAPAQKEDISGVIVWPF